MGYLVGLTGRETPCAETLFFIEINLRVLKFSPASKQLFGHNP